MFEYFEANIVIQVRAAWLKVATNSHIKTHTCSLWRQLVNCISFIDQWVCLRSNTKTLWRHCEVSRQCKISNWNILKQEDKGSSPTDRERADASLMRYFPKPWLYYPLIRIITLEGFVSPLPAVVQVMTLVLWVFSQFSASCHHSQRSYEFQVTEIEVTPK